MRLQLLYRVLMRKTSSALLRMWDAAISFVLLLFFGSALRFSSFRNTHTLAHVKSDGSTAAAAEGSISCLLCLDLQSTYFSFFSSQHVQACLLSCCLPVSCLAVLLSPDCWRFSSSSPEGSTVSSYASRLQSLGYTLIYTLSFLPSLVYPLLSTLSSLLFPDYPLRSPFTCLPSPGLPFLSILRCLHSPVSPFYPLLFLLSTLSCLSFLALSLSTLIHSSFFQLPSPFPICCWMDVWDAGINVCVCVLSSSTSSATALPLPYPPPPPHHLSSPPPSLSCKNMQFYRSLQICHSKRGKKKERE